MARSTADTLGARCVTTGKKLNRGEVAQGVWELLELIPRLNRFLSYVELCEEVLWESQPHTADIVREYKLAALVAVDRVQSALDQERYDLAGVELGKTLGDCLRHYADMAADIEGALEWRAAA